MLAPLGQYGRILDYMREAEALARELGDRRRLGLVLADIGARLRNVGDHERAIDASRQALDIATELEDAGLQIEAKYRLAQAHFAIGDLSKATVLFMETVHSLADESVVRRAALPAFFAAWPRAWLGLAFSHLGRFAEALDYAEGAIRIAEGADHPHTLVEAHGALGGVSLERGDLQSALRVFEQGVGLLRRRGFGDANVLSGLGYAYSLAGRLTEGLPLLEEAVQIGDSISAMGLGHAVRISRLAEAYAMAGRPDEALDRAHHAIDLSRKHKERANEALGLRVLAEIMTRVEPLDTEAIAEHYATSLSLAKELGMRPLVAHCHLGLGNLYSRTGRRQESRECFRIAAGMYLEMGMQFWLDRPEAGMSRSA
ncbi:MAG TPA: tetratricopeptide repeat protein [Verrucomicrobiae bacterium]|nr:tetratricopeptide repeat protein [Verrucomicrobiae bacterium]